MNRIKEISRELERLNQYQNDLYHEYASHIGLSDTVFWILYLVYGEEEMFTQNQIADLWHMPRQSINSAAASLVKRGFLRLEKLPLARNNKGLCLTEAGKAFCERMIRPFYLLEERVIEAIPEEEREMYLKISRKWNGLFAEEIQAAVKKLSGNMYKI